MARCDCAGGRCACGVTAGDGIEVTGSGEGTNPYVINALQQPMTGLLTVQDTATINLTLNGQGETNEPYILSAQVIAEPPPTAITGLIEVADSVTLDLTLAGTGTTADPYIISGEATSELSPAITDLIEIDPTDTLALTMTGTGTSADPYILSGESRVPPPTPNMIPDPTLRDRTWNLNGATGTAFNDEDPGVPGYFHRAFTFATANTVSPVTVRLTGTGLDAVPVTAGEVYNVSAYFHKDGVPFNVRFAATYYDASGTQLSVQQLASGSILVGVWTRHNAAFTPPVNTAFVGLVATFSGIGTAGMTIRVGAALLVEGATAPDYVPPTPLRLNDLLDVDAALPASGEVLVWNGSAWAASDITPTPQDVSDYRLAGSTVWDAPDIAHGAQASTTVSVPGVAVADAWVFDATAEIDLLGLNARAAVTAADTVTIYLSNMTGASVNLASGVFRVYGWR